MEGRCRPNYLSMSGNGSRPFSRHHTKIEILRGIRLSQISLREIKGSKGCQALSSTNKTLKEPAGEVCHTTRSLSCKGRTWKVRMRCLSSPVRDSSIWSKRHSPSSTISAIRRLGRGNDCLPHASGPVPNHLLFQIHKLKGRTGANATCSYSVTCFTY